MKYTKLTNWKWHLAALKDTGAFFALRLVIVACGLEGKLKCLLSRKLRVAAFANSLKQLLNTIPCNGEELVKRAADKMDRMIEVVFRDIAKSFSKTHAMTLVPVYTSTPERDRLYNEGDRDVVITTLSNLRVVDDEQLTWEQVFEFRKDKETRDKYKRLLHWLDKEMVGKSQVFIQDEVAIRLRDYEDGLKKHGIKTVLGTIEEALDGKYLLGVAGAAAPFTIAGRPVLGALAGASLLVGKVAVKLAQTMLEFDDVERGQNSEISWVFEVKKLGEQAVDVEAKQIEKC